MVVIGGDRDREENMQQGKETPLVCTPDTLGSTGWTQRGSRVSQQPSETVSNWVKKPGIVRGGLIVFVSTAEHCSAVDFLLSEILSRILPLMPARMMGHWGISRSYTKNKIKL